MDDLKVLGLVLELNPPHKGHEYFINEAKKRVNPDVVIAVISSSFSQRGDIMVLDKFTKTKIALDLGIDIVLELPYLASVASADYFCFNAVNILTKFKITDLAFGVEMDNLEKFNHLLSLVNSQLFHDNIKSFFSKGYSYSTSCNKALGELTTDLELIKNYSLPNNTLGLQYLKALNKLNYECNITLIKRIENNYYDENINGVIASAQAIRNKMVSKENIDDYIVNSNIEYINIEKAYNNLYKLLQYAFINNKNISNILGVGEGIENRMRYVVENSDDYNDFLNKCITKRYTYNHIKRIVLNILLNVETKNVTNNTDDNIDINNNNNIIFSNNINCLEYLRVLGFNKTGESYLNTLPKEIKTSLFTTFKKKNSYLVDLELRATKLYGVLVDKKNIDSEEYNIPIRRK